MWLCKTNYYDMYDLIIYNVKQCILYATYNINRTSKRKLYFTHCINAIKIFVLYATIKKLNTRKKRNTRKTFWCCRYMRIKQPPEFGLWITVCKLRSRDKSSGLCKRFCDRNNIILCIVVIIFFLQNIYKIYILYDYRYIPIYNYIM